MDNVPWSFLGLIEATVNMTVAGTHWQGPLECSMKKCLCLEYLGLDYELIQKPDLLTILFKIKMSHTAMEQSSC